MLLNRDKWLLWSCCCLYLGRMCFMVLLHLSIDDLQTGVLILQLSESESDIRPSMVTYTQNSCSAFNPSKVHTHSSEYTHREHAPGIHYRSSGQPMLRHPGSIWGFGALLKGISVVVLRVERALYIHSPHLQFLPAWDSNLLPLDYKSDLLGHNFHISCIRTHISRIHTGSVWQLCIY